MERSTHIVHDREEDRTLGYRIVENDSDHVAVVCAETRCHPNDNFNKATARAHVNSRLDSYMDGNRSPRLRVFEADVNVSTPQNARDYRELEATLLALSEYRLPTPAALRE